MRAALIFDGVVINIVEIDPENEWTPPDDITVVETENAGIGWTYDGEVFTPSAPSMPTQEEYVHAIELHLDNVVKQRGYSSILSAASYSGDPIYGAEGDAAKAWRSAVWAYAYAELAKVLNGTRTQPTVDELIDELPTIEWPT